MRVAAMLVAVVALATAPLAARSASAAPVRAVNGHSSNVIQVAEGCGAGYHWVGGHRSSATGRWVPGHCAHN